MKVKVWFYVLTDAMGNQTFDVVNDLSDNISIGGYDKDDNYQQYDSYEGYHEYGWAEKHGFVLECIDKTIELEPKTVVLRCIWCGDAFIKGKGIDSEKYMNGYCSAECKQEMEPTK